MSKLISTVMSLAEDEEEKQALSPLSPLDSRELHEADVFAQDLHTLLYQLSAVSELLGALRYSVLDQPVPAKDFDKTLKRLRGAQTTLREVIFKKFRRRA